MTDAVLEVEDLSAGYAGEMVVHHVSFAVEPGEAVAIIGSNGAGKTTLFHAIVSMLRKGSGTVRFDGADITRLPTHRIARRGLAYVAAERHLFPEMSVAENLRLGAYPHRPVSGVEDSVYEVFPRLAERRKQAAGTMSGGEQQMLAVGRALMSDPRVLLVDEPSVGLAPILVSRMIAKIKELKEKRQLTVMMAEQNFNQAIKIADRGYIIVHGEIAFASKDADDMRENEMVKSYYLGG